jgi:hypothetical protein
MYHATQEKDRYPHKRDNGFLGICIPQKGSHDCEQDTHEDSRRSNEVEDALHRTFPFTPLYILAFSAADDVDLHQQESLVDMDKQPHSKW